MRKIYAELTADGTAMSETAICSECLDTDERFFKDAMPPITLVDCTGNDAIGCESCGYGCYRISNSAGDIGMAFESEIDLCEDVEGCRGTQYVVEWPDGEQTIVCGKGLDWQNETTAQIMEVRD